MMCNPYYYTDIISIDGIKIDLDIDRINQLYSKLVIGPNHPEY